MAILNTITCAAAGSNTGIPDCALTLKNVVGGFLVPNSFELTNTQLADSASVQAALLAAVNNNNPALRIYPLPEVVGITDNSEDPVTQTLGFGATVIVRDGKYNLTFQYTKGGNCVSNALTKFNNGNYKYIGFDAQGVLFGTKVGTSLKGIPLDFFYNRPFKFNDGSNIAVYSYQISFNPNYINTGLGFLQMDLSVLQAYSGLLNVNLSLPTIRVTNVIKVKANTGCSGADLYDLYATELAAVSAWVVTEAGKNITITSVAVDANLKAWTITLDATDPDYTVGGPFIVSLASVSVLTGLGVVGYESLPLTVA